MRLRERMVRLLRRLFRRKRRWYEVDMTRLDCTFLSELCANGDYATVCGRPDKTIQEVMEWI